ncbi:Protein-L-isoaspartate O-methyltransferase [Smittium culicis]|uniref:protein-L-isoaspartate(D-aspartate) O-methyltransferase n=1 Tax=Smittium culicis TaxID=133412 RepID=A0A1R1YKB0_9FUNG|nr:Protein-L-isoaspartate O-methyltransferase [Smittium culicis]
MKLVDRGDYTNNLPYQDSPQPLGHMHAYALEYLEEYLKPGNKVLDVGSGSGYLTACMAAMVEPNGLVVGVDHVKQLVNLSVSNISVSNSRWLDSGLIKMVTGDGRKGCIEYGPYDCM